MGLKASERARGIAGLGSRSARAAVRRGQGSGLALAFYKGSGTGALADFEDLQKA